MNMPPSWVLFAVIVFGGALAVVGNTLYPLATEQEKRARLAGDAWAILKPEIADNKSLAQQMQAEEATRTMVIRQFDVSAWETVSKGGLLLGLDAADIRKLLLIYKKCYQANEKSAELHDLIYGTSAAPVSRPQLIGYFNTSLKTTITELEQAIDDLNPTRQ